MGFDHVVSLVANLATASVAYKSIFVLAPSVLTLIVYKLYCTVFFFRPFCTDLIEPFLIIVLK